MKNESVYSEFVHCPDFTAMYVDFQLEDGKKGEMSRFSKESPAWRKMATGTPGPKVRGEAVKALDDLLKKVTDEIVPALKARKDSKGQPVAGGYTSVVKVAPRRGDGTPRSVLQLNVPMD